MGTVTDADPIADGGDLSGDNNKDNQADLDNNPLSPDGGVPCSPEEMFPPSLISSLRLCSTRMGSSGWILLQAKEPEIFRDEPQQPIQIWNNKKRSGMGPPKMSLSRFSILFLLFSGSFSVSGAELSRKELSQGTTTRSWTLSSGRPSKGQSPARG